MWIILLGLLLPNATFTKSPELKEQRYQSRLEQRAYKALREKRCDRVLHFYNKLTDVEVKGNLLADIYDQLRPGDCTRGDIEQLQAITIAFQEATGQLPKIHAYWRRRLPKLFSNQPGNL